MTLLQDCDNEIDRLEVEVERLKKIVAIERRTATELAEQLRRIEAILNE